jgi:hypothetical protein
MRKEYDFSKAVRVSAVLRRRQRGVASGRGHERGAGGVPLTAAQLREIKRRAADLDDPVRYLLASQMTPRFVLYYNVSDDTYVLNEPKLATLFKRRKAAESVKRLLGGRIRIIRCTTKHRNGQRVPVLPRHSRRGKNA